jgi:hypothetical protein
MPIIQDPNSPGGYVNRIDEAQKSGKKYTAFDTADLSSASLSLAVSNLEENWKVDEISLKFSNATARTYAVSKLAGRGVLTHKNDYFWLAHTDVVAQRIILSQGFYENSVDFVAEIKSKLDGNTAFSDAGITFTVSYDASTKLITITPSSGSIKYLYNNTAQGVRRLSLAGPVIGFLADTGFATSLTGDTPVDIGTKYLIIDGTGSTVTDFVSTDDINMDLDSALLLTGTTGPAVVMDARVTYSID